MVPAARPLDQNGDRESANDLRVGDELAIGGIEDSALEVAVRLEGSLALADSPVGTAPRTTTARILPASARAFADAGLVPSVARSQTDASRPAPADGTPGVAPGIPVSPRTSIEELVSGPSKRLGVVMFNDMEWTLHYWTAGITVRALVDEQSSWTGPLREDRAFVDGSTSLAWTSARSAGR